MSTVFFASNRVLTGPASAVGSYGNDIQPPSTADALTYGTAFVSSTFAITEITAAPGGFSPGTADDIANAGRNLLVFVHGFDNDFDDGITRAAFNRDWMAASGVSAQDFAVIAFSWPSRGRVIGFPLLQAAYLEDQHMARASGFHLMAFFRQMQPFLRKARQNGQQTILLAHSMGNLALESAVENWFLHGNPAAPLFDLAVLAAADCGNNSFAQPNLARLSGLDRLADRISIYYSEADAVLGLSQAVNIGAKRLGQDGPLHRTDAGVFQPSRYRMVDATTFRDYSDFNPITSHQYYRKSDICRREIARDVAGFGA